MSSSPIRLESSYLPDEEGCRIIWNAKDESDEKILYLRKEELEKLADILDHDSSGKIELEDGASSIMVNSDSTECFMANQRPLQVQTSILKEKLWTFLSQNK